jgi:hypothetical protein
LRSVCSDTGITEKPEPGKYFTTSALSCYCFDVPDNQHMTKHVLSQFKVDGASDFVQALEAFANAGSRCLEVKTQEAAATYRAAETLPIDSGDGALTVAPNSSTGVATECRPAAQSVTAQSLQYIHTYIALASGWQMLLGLCRRVRTVREMLGEARQENATPGLQMLATVCHTL